MYLDSKRVTSGAAADKRVRLMYVASLQLGAGVAAPLPPSVLCTAPLTPS